MTWVPLKRVADVRPSNVDKLTVEGERPVRLVNYTDVYYGDRLHPGLDLMTATATAEEMAKFRLRQGDVLLTKDSETADDIGVSAYVEDASPDMVCGYHLSLVRPRDVYGRYLHYALSSTHARSQMTVAATGVTRYGLRAESVGSLMVWMPPLMEQRAIADYLDAETARIDALIAKKQQLIDLLDERWASWSAVVLDAGARVQVRHVTSLRTSGPRGWAENVREVGRPFVRSANLRQNSIDLKLDDVALVEAADSSEALRSQIQPGDSLVGITGANTSWTAWAHPVVHGGFVSQHVAILRPVRVDGRWLAYSIASPQARDQLLGGQYGGTKTQLSLEDLAALEICAPSRSEQIQRVALLDAQHRVVTALLGLLKSQIALLAEHRQSTITAAVAGRC